MILLVLSLWGIIGVVLIMVFKSLIHYLSIVVHLQKLPGPPSKNIFSGNISPLSDTPENVFKAIRKWGLDYYPIYKNWVVHITVANIMNPYDLETILPNTKHIAKGLVYDMLHAWLGTGLLTSGGNKWHTRRKILTPAFHFNILQEFVKIFDEESIRLVEKLKKECHNPYINVNDYISAFTLNTIGETAMGTNFNLSSVSLQEYKKAINEIGKIYLYKLSRPWLLNKFINYFDANCCKEKRLVKILHQFTSDVIDEREKNFKSVGTEDFSYSKRKRLAMLDLLLTAKKESLIDEEGIREEVDTFMFEGHDTTSVAICFALMLIACDRDIQDRIVEEMQENFHVGSKFDYTTLQELKYLERCIKEVLRMYPSVPFIARVLGEDIVTHNGHLLKAGSLVHLHIYDLHHNPNIYPDPEKFDPDRFLPENCQNRHSFAYIPFSAGPRNCIGQKFANLEIKTVICRILSEFVLQPVDTPSTITMICDLVLRTKKGIRIKFVPRKNKILHNVTDVLD